DALSKSINSRRFIAVPEAQDWALYRLNLAHWISPPMSALGQKQTSQHLQPMSALPPKADVKESRAQVGGSAARRCCFIGLVKIVRPNGCRRPWEIWKVAYRNPHSGCCLTSRPRA